MRPAEGAAGAIPGLAGASIAGPVGETTVQIKNKDGSTVTLSSGGRGVDLDGDGQILDFEGCVVDVPVPFGVRDCLRQTLNPPGAPVSSRRAD